MGEFTIKVAGHTAYVSSLFESTRDYCREYLTEEAAEIFITVSREDLAQEQRLADEEAREEGLRQRNFTDPFLERAVIQRKLAEALLERDVLLLHGSTVAVDGEGYLFTANKCGTGKSTHTRLWRELFGSRAVMVNDDKPFLKLTEEGILACGAPWTGKHGLGCNVTVPLKGICILQRGTENRIRRIGAEEAAGMVWKQSAAPLAEEKLPKYRCLVETLLEKAAFWQMECTRDMAAAKVSFEAMSGKE